MSLLANKIIQARELRQPLFSTLEVTQSCNLKCKHCYNFDRLGPNSQVPQKFIELDFAKNIIDQLAHLGSLSLNITGGEPLLHPQLLSIIDHAKKNNFHLRLKTNGLLLSEDLAQKLFGHGLREVDISLYGENEEDYLSFCGKMGFQKTILAIRNAQKANLKVNISLILHKGNFKKLPQLIAICENLNVFYNVSDEITDRHDKSHAKEQLGLSQADYLYLLNSPHSYFFEQKNPERNLLCGCAKTVIGINVYGDVFPCIGAPLFCGNLHKDSLEDIWFKSQELQKIRNLKNEDLKDCSSCELVEQCSRSSGSALLNSGDYAACDPMALEHAKARKIHSEK